MVTRQTKDRRNTGSKLCISHFSSIFLHILAFLTSVGSVLFIQNINSLTFKEPVCFCLFAGWLLFLVFVFLRVVFNRQSEERP